MDLPPEILQLVLNHCELPELKQFLLVSEEFRDLILSTPRLMRRLKLFLCRDTWKDEIPFIEKHGELIRSMKFDNCVMDINEIKRILSLTPNVENLEFYMYDQPNEETEPAVEEVAKSDNGIELNLSVLKSVNIGAYESLTKEIMSALYNSKNVVKFVIEAYFSLPLVEVGNFLGEQNNLEEILLQGHNEFGITSVFTEKLTSNKNLKLKTLKIQSTLEYNKQISDFLKSQSNHIEVLDVKNYTVDFHYYRLIFKNFKKLKKISFSINYTFNEARCAELAECLLPTVTEFESDDIMEDAAAFASIMKSFPNLETINAPYINFPLNGIFETLPKLRTFTARSFKFDLMLFASSLSLREFEFYGCDSMMLNFLWERLADDFPNIERLVIKNVAAYKFVKTTAREVELILKNLKNFKRLRYVELENDVDVSSHPGEDHDNPAIQIIPNDTLKFKLALQKKFDGTYRLKVSTYFNQRHAETIERVKKDFDISDVTEEN